VNSSLAQKPVLEYAHATRVGRFTNSAKPNCYALCEDSRQKECKKRRCGNTLLPSTRRRCARKALFRKLIEIFAPIILAILTEFEKIIPTKDSGCVHVVESKPHRVIADRMHFEDLHIPLAADRAPLARRVALHFGARTAYAQIFGGKIEALTAVESDAERRSILVQSQFCRPRSRHVELPIVNQA
jgi:hypothetical protein